MERDRVKIERDVFDIADRIKEIDPGYFVMLNLRTGKFEVHHDGRGRQGRGGSLCLTLPFGRLDARAVTEVYRTRLERRERLLREMEEFNLKSEKSRLKEIIANAENKWEKIKNDS